MNDGWIKLYRKIFNNPYYFSEKFCRSMAWVDLLLLANHKPGIIYKRGIKVNVAVGQVGNGVESLAKRWRWSKGKVLRWLSELEMSGQIERQKNNVTTLITIINYKEYQSNGTANGTANESTDESADRLTDGYGTRKEKNDKNEKNKEINIAFEIFWNTYDKKKGDRGKCEMKWNKLSDETRSKIIETLPSFISSIRDKQFQPYPMTYLNQERWNDDLTPTVRRELKPIMP